MAEIVGWDVAGSDTVLASQCPQNFAGTTAQTIAASAVGTIIELKPLKAFRPDRIVVDRVQAASLLLDDLKIGTTSLNASNGSIAMDAFAPDAQGTSMRAPMQASQNLSMFFKVTNKTAVAVTNFVIGVIGPTQDL